MIKEEIINTLRSIGLSRNEIIIYLDLIKSGKSSALDISKRTMIHRSNTYDSLEKLLEKGVIDLSIEEDKKFFFPVEPEDLLDYLKQKEKEIEKLIPYLQEISKWKEEKRISTISEGANSAKNIINHLLDFKDNIYLIGMSKKIEYSIEGFFKEFNRRRVKKRIHLKTIYDVDALKYLKCLAGMDYTEARYFPLQESRVTTFIIHNKIVITSWNTPVITIIVKDHQIAKTYKNYFDIIWNISKKVI